MAKKEEKPEHIAKYERLRKKFHKLLHTHSHHHTKAYLDAAEALLKDEEGNIDYEKLEDKNTQEKFVDKMMDFYLSKAKGVFKGKPKDEFEESLMMRYFDTFTREELARLIKQHGKNYTAELHEQQKEKLQEGLIGKIGHLPHAHFREEHLPDIIKYVNAQDLVDPSKMRLEDALSLLGIYHKTGEIGIPEEAIRKMPYYKKKK